VGITIGLIRNPPIALSHWFREGLFFVALHKHNREKKFSEMHVLSGRAIPITKKAADAASDGSNQGLNRPRPSVERAMLSAPYSAGAAPSIMGAASLPASRFC
jgi:hypothetical protein